MNNTVVYRTAKDLAAAGFDVLRFNFRGVGASEGAHDEGRGELDDYAAALAAIAARGCAPLLACGYSFGAIQAIRAAAADARVFAAAAIGLPVSLAPAELLRSFTKPLLLVQGSGDPFGAPAELRGAVAGAPRARVVELAGTGHFFEGRAADAARAVAEFAAAALAEAPIPR
jgi:alpha/beta superfamily hydrolase